MSNTQVIADFIACVYLGNQSRLSFTAMNDTINEGQILTINKQ